VNEPVVPTPETPGPGNEAPNAEGPAAGLPLPPDRHTVTLTLRAAPARQGVAWVQRGFGAFMTRPLALAGLFAMFLFTGLMALLLPIVGGVLVLMSLPLVSLAFMLATQAIEHDRTPLPGVFVAPLTTDAARRFALIQLGLAYAVASFALVTVTDWLDGGTFEALQQALASDRPESRQQVDALLADPQLQTGMVVRLVLAAALAIPFWHAPALVHWGGQGVAQALFSSTLAVWRNKGAFLAYAAAWVVVVGVFMLLVNLVALAFQAPMALTAVMMPAVLMFSTAFYASLYFTFVDCFGVRAASRPSLRVVS
jgi:hypothetical protein